MRKGSEVRPWRPLPDFGPEVEGFNFYVGPDGYVVTAVSEKERYIIYGRDACFPNGPLPGEPPVVKESRQEPTVTARPKVPRKEKRRVAKDSPEV